MPAALCIINSSALRNAAAIHGPEISANHQTFAVVNAFGCSSPFWIQFVLVLIWEFKFNMMPFSPTTNDRSYGVWVWISRQGPFLIVEDSVLSVG